MWVGMFKANQQSKSMYEQSVKGMQSVLSEPRLIDGLVPDFSVGCRRTPAHPLLPGADYSNY
jgi:hypothetical protein